MKAGMNSGSSSPRSPGRPLTRRKTSAEPLTFQSAPKRSQREMETFYNEHKQQLQTEFGKALDDTMCNRYSEHPIAHIGRRLLESQGIDTSSLNLNPDQPTELEKKLEPMLMRSASMSHINTSGGRSSPPKQAADTRTSDGSGVPQWDMRHWLASLSLDEKIYAALKLPLPDDDGDEETARENEEFLLSCLGEMTSKEPIERLLQDSDLLGDLAHAIWTSAKKMVEMHGQASSGSEGFTGGTTSKFFEDDASSSTLKFGDTSVFYEGLDGFIGPPNPDLGDAMQNEHCRAADADKEFLVPNYRTRTTSRKEYWFVADPSDGRKAELEIRAWPHEGALFDEATGTAKNKEEARKAARKPLPLSSFEAERNERNAQLSEKGLDPLQEEELVAARLYTGPMYVKYNWVLRSIGHIRSATERDASFSEQQLRDKLVERGRAEYEKLKQGSSLGDGRLGDTTGATEGNLYTTTLHVISSAVLKLGKLTRANKVYRGISRKTVPQKLKVKDKMSNTRGGVEYGFLSCSLVKKEALKYATLGKTQTPLLLEIQQGMIDRGADLSWLSQYPLEQEVMFPPLTGLEFLYHSVEDGHVLVVTVRPSVNLRSLTFEQVVAKMQSSHVQLVDLLTDGLRFAGVPRSALQPLINLKTAAKQREPSWYNATRNYREATELAIQTQTTAFEALSGAGRDGDEAPLADSMEVDKILGAAELAARAGEHKVAIDLLLRRRFRQDDYQRGEPIAQSLAKVAQELLEGGCKQPWPPTLALIASEELFGLKTAVLARGEFERIVREALARQERDGDAPFRVGSRVLVCPDFKKANWVVARVKRGVYEREGGPVYGRSGELKFSGRMYDIEGLGGEQSRAFHEEAVITTTRHGIPELLGIAAESGDVDLVRSLLDARANVYCTDMRGSTALIRIADAVKGIQPAAGGHTDVIELLLARYPSQQFYELRNRMRQNAFDLAVLRHSTGALRVMQRSNKICPSDLEISDTDRDEFLGRVPLSDWAAAPHKEWPSGVTTLMLAIRLIRDAAERLSTVKELLRNGAAVDATSQEPAQYATTALMYAVDDNDADVVRALIDAAADVNAVDSTKRSPLIQAAQFGFVAVTRVLIEHKANVMYQRKGERSVLSYASQYGHVEIARLLLDSADALGDGQKAQLVNMTKNDSGEDSALAFAARFGQKDMVKLLIQQGNDVAGETAKPYFSSLHRACANGHTETASLLIHAHGKFINHESGSSATPLMAAASSGHLRDVMLLVQEKADLMMTNQEGKTALWLAAQNAHVDVVRYLASHDSSEQHIDFSVEFDPGNSAEERPGRPKRDGTAPSSAAAASDQLPPPPKSLRKQPMSALMVAALSGNATVVRALHAALSTSVQLLGGGDMKPHPSKRVLGRSDEGKTLAASPPPPGLTTADGWAQRFVVREGPNAHGVVRTAFWGKQNAKAATPPCFSDGYKTERSFTIKRVDEGEESTLVTLEAEDDGSVVQFECPEGGFDDALCLATRYGHVGVVRALCGFSKATSRLEHAEKLARVRQAELAAKASANSDAADDGKPSEQQTHMNEITLLLQRPRVQRSRTISRLESQNFNHKQDVESRVRIVNQVLPNLAWEVAEGQHVAPPRPTELDLSSERTATGPLVVEKGIVVQRGPHQSVWIRVGCVREHTPWHKVLQTLQMYVVVVEAHMQHEAAQSGALFVAVSVRSMQAIDFAWLAERGFTFHHYRTNLGVTEAQYCSAVALHESAELVFCAWPARAASQSLVRGAAAGVEFVTGVVLSRDERRVMLVWERGAWCTPVGMVDTGASRLDALKSEVLQAAGLSLDHEWQGTRYLGGWQQQRARDPVVSDSFSVFTARSATEWLDPDDNQLVPTRWAEWRPLLAAWRADGMPRREKYWLVPDGFDPGATPGDAPGLSAGEKILTNLLHWLDTYETGRGLPIATQKPLDGYSTVAKATINTLH